MESLPLRLKIDQKVRTKRTTLIGQLKRLADANRLPMLILHYTRKQPAEDAFGMISGITGLLGPADDSLLMQKRKNRTFFVAQCIENFIDLLASHFRPRRDGFTRCSAKIHIRPSIWDEPLQFRFYPRRSSNRSNHHLHRLCFGSGLHAGLPWRDSHRCT